MKSTTTYASTTLLPEDFAVFVACSSSSTNPIFQETAHDVAQPLVALGVDLVTGGGQRGLMGVVHHEFEKNLYNEQTNPNGSKIHVVTIRQYEHDISNLTYTDVAIKDTVSERKDAMFKMAKAMIALPGGSGTLDELASAGEARNVEEISYPIIIVNVNGYFDNFIAQYKKAIDMGVSSCFPFTTVNTAQEAIEILRTRFGF